MKIKFLLAIGLVYIFTIGLAQQNSTPDTLKNDIGFNTTFLVNGIFTSNQTPFTLMYKKYTRNNQAFRFGLSTFVSQNKISPNTIDTTNTYQNSSSFSLLITIGKEFQKTISPKWIWYLGGDLVPSYSNFSNSETRGNTKIHDTKNKSLGISAKPFLGIRFNIHPRLYLSAEASLSAGYFSSSRISNSDIYVNQNSDVDYSSFTLALNPAAGLFLFYRF